MSQAFRTLSALTLSLGVVSLPLTCGCSRPPVPESSPPASREPLDDRPRQASAELEALAERLQAITAEVALSAERRVHGVHRAASYQADQEFPQRVRAVVMNVNVSWCNDGCIDGPAETPVKNEDLLLLRPFAESLETLDVQHTEITDAGLETIAHLTRLESLNLAGTAIDGRGLAQLGRLDKLRHLDLRDTAIQPEHLRTLSVLKSLHTIELPAAAITDEVLAVLGQLLHLRSLVLAKAPVSDRGLAHLAPLKQLETLDLSETGITDAGLSHLAGLTNLRQLRLSHTRITGAGLSHLARLASLQELELADTAVDDAGLAHLSELRELISLQLTGTQVRGDGLAHLRACEQLRQVTLPPIPAAAVEAVNAVKSWHRLSLTLVGEDDLPPPASATSVTISDMPELSHLGIVSESPLHAVHIENCPQLAGLAVSHGAAQLPGTALHLNELQALRDITLVGAFREFEGDGVLKQVARIVFAGSLTPDTVRGINRCRSLESLDMQVTEVTGAPVPSTELQALPHALNARIRLETMDASWLLRLIGKMPALKRLDLRGRGLTASALAALSSCTQLEYLGVRGIDDPGEPLAFLHVMPKLDQCLVLGCPRVGRIRLTKQAGVRRLYFKYGRLDELEIDGAPNLTAVYLGHEAFGYNDDDARLNTLDVGWLTVRNTANLLYLMVDGLESTLPFTEISLADTPKLRSLLLRAPPAERQPIKCRLMTEGAFPNLVQRRLFHLRADQASLDRLNDSPALRGGDMDAIEVSRRFNGPGRAAALPPEQEGGPLAAVPCRRP